MSSPQVELAKRAIEAYVGSGKKIDPPRPLLPELKERAGVFVSIHKNGGLRGCIGTFLPTKSNIAEEIIANAIHAATEDPRYPPVEAEEVPELEISVDVLTYPEPANMSELDPKKYGIIVSCGYRKGLLLPDLEGVDTAEMQIDICRQKAGIDESEPVKLEKFCVKRYH